MLRFILKREICCEERSSVDYQTVDLDIPEIEEKLSQGGFGELGFDHTTLVGIEVIATAIKEALA